MINTEINPFTRFRVWLQKYIGALAAIYNVLIWLVLYSVSHVFFTFSAVTLMHYGLQYQFANKLIIHGNYMLVQMTALFIIFLSLFSLITLIIGRFSKNTSKEINYKKLIKHTWFVGLDFIGSVSILLLIVCILIFPELSKPQVIISIVFALLLHGYKGYCRNKG